MGANAGVIDRPDPGDERRPGILVADATPLALLADVPGGLDWLFVPGARVWLTDIIVDEVTRDPGAGRDQRIEHRGEIADWIGRNRWRIKRLETRVGRRYAAEMAAWANAAALWRLAGRPTGMEPPRPDWSDLGDRSIWHGINAAQAAIAVGEAVIVLADDGGVRAAVEAKVRQQQQVSIDLMGTQTFIQWLVEDFAVAGVDTAWQTIADARRGAVPSYGRKGDADPVYFRIPCIPRPSRHQARRRHRDPETQRCLLTCTRPRACAPRLRPPAAPHPDAETRPPILPAPGTPAACCSNPPTHSPRPAAPPPPAAISDWSCRPRNTSPPRP